MTIAMPGPVGSGGLPPDERVREQDEHLRHLFQAPAALPDAAMVRLRDVQRTRDRHFVEALLDARDILETREPVLAPPSLARARVLTLMTTAILGVLVVSAAFASAIVAAPAPPVVVPATPPEMGQVTLSLQAQPEAPEAAKAWGLDRVAVCHKPGTAAGHTILVAQVAVEAHVAHGDAVAQCDPENPDLPPVADFTWECQALACAFDAAPSFDPDGTIVGWAWDFEGLGAATGEQAAFTFPAAGTYEVLLTVTDDLGAMGLQVARIHVQAPDDGGGGGGSGGGGGGGGAGGGPGGNGTGPGGGPGGNGTGPGGGNGNSTQPGGNGTTPGGSGGGGGAGGGSGGGGGGSPPANPPNGAGGGGGGGGAPAAANEADIVAATPLTLVGDPPADDPAPRPSARARSVAPAFVPREDSPAPLLTGPWALAYTFPGQGLLAAAPGRRSRRDEDEEGLNEEEDEQLG